MATQAHAGGDPWTEGRLTDALLARLTPPTKGYRIRWHGELAGFGLRVTSTGARAFVLRYRNREGRDRTLTIGSPPAWTVAKAAEQAKSLRRSVDSGEDPMGQRDADRAAQSVAELWEAFEQDDLASRRPSTQDQYRRMWRQYLAPQIGRLKIAAVTKEDVASLVRRIAKDHPYQANRVLALASVLFSLAIERELRATNPTARITKAPEERRERFLTPLEIGRLNNVLAAHSERTSAAAIQLMLLTGCRRGEALAAKWAEFDLITAVWVKPSTNTKSRKPHRIPLSSAAVELLRKLESRRVQRDGLPSPYVFQSGKRAAAQLTEVKRTWASACKAAGLSGVRLHDLRHTFASALVSGGLNLPVIGQLLGHSQQRTTARYSHLYDDVLRDAAEHVGQIANGKGRLTGEEAPIASGRRH